MQTRRGFEFELGSAYIYSMIVLFECLYKLLGVLQIEVVEVRCKVKKGFDSEHVRRGLGVDGSDNHFTVGIRENEITPRVDLTWSEHDG